MPIWCRLRRTQTNEKKGFHNPDPRVWDIEIAVAFPIVIIIQSAIRDKTDQSIFISAITANQPYSSSTFPTSSG